MEYGLQKKIKRAKSMCRKGVNKTFEVEHPDWVKDASTNNFVVLTKKITDDHNKYQKERIDRRVKQFGK